MRYRRAAAAAAIAKTKAFKRPSPAHMNRLWEFLKQKNSSRWRIVTQSPTNNNLSPNKKDLQLGHFVDIYRQKGRYGIHPSIGEVYIQFVCEYVNRANNRNAPGQIPVCAVMEASFFKTYFEAYVGGKDTSAASAQLHRAGLGPAKFLQVRHLFLLDRSFPGHIGLIVISPQARTVDYLDSATPRFDEEMGVVFRMISDHLGDSFLPYEWKVRQGHCPQQYCQRDCAIYTALNAMLIAFGYPIEYKRMDMLNRRYRMATELLNGANGVFFTPDYRTSVPKEEEEFHYELTDYWTGDRASDRSRGFQSLSKTMLYFLPKEVQARGRTGKYWEKAKGNRLEEGYK